MSVIYDSAPLKERVERVLADDFKHEAIKTAQDVIGSKRDVLVAEQGQTWEELRFAAALIRNHVLENLDYYLQEFCENADRAGNILHFAPTGEDAVDIVLNLFEELGATRCVKTKSMVTEEIGLNEALIEHGVALLETDCAEHILQTAQDPPSHIVVPALHFDRVAIRNLYHEKLGYEGTESPEEITQFLRQTLRPEFLSARVGITGCNFGVAESGSCTLVTNEGNGRMITCAPETQIVLMGAERIVPDLKSLDVMMALLVRSAVGSKITSSFSLSTSPRREGEIDGPAQVHIIVVNNSRSDILRSEFSDMLRCIRCGACMNTCPVYRHITGHGYGSIYPGPMGLVLTPLLEGYQAIEKMEAACTLCGACSDVCPVKIPLHNLILQHRCNLVDQGYVSSAEKSAFNMAARFMSSKGMYKTGTKLGSFGMKILADKTHRVGKKSTWIPVLKGWTSVRDMNLMASKKFRDEFAEHKHQRDKQQSVSLQSDNQAKPASSDDVTALHQRGDDTHE